MMRSVSVFGICSLAAAALIAACVEATSPVESQAGAKAGFTAKGSDGKTHTLKSLSTGKTLVLYFIKDGCPVNHQALPHFKKIAEAYKGSKNVQFVGVINGTEGVYKRWNQQYKTDYLVLFDPEYEIIRQYKATASPWAIVIGNDGQTVDTLKGFSGPSLSRLNAKMAESAGIPQPSLDFPGTPRSDQVG